MVRKLKNHDMGGARERTGRFNSYDFYIFYKKHWGEMLVWGYGWHYGGTVLWS